MFPKKLARILSMFLAVCMLLAGPSGATRAEAFPGIKSIAVGAAAGGAAALGVGALIGAMGMTAAVGLPGLALVGAALGGIVTTMVGNDGAASTGSAIGLGALAAGAGAGTVALSGFLFSPWVLLPAAAIGIGALAWSYMKRPNQFGGPGDIRNTSGFSSGFFSPQTRLGNQSPTGYNSGDRSALDRLRNIFDRNRRDDNFLGGSQMNPDGSLRSRNDLFARIGVMFNGMSNTGSYGGGSQFYGPGYGNAGYFSPGSQPRTDRLGQVSVGGAGRAGFASAPVSAELDAAQAARDEAYKALVSSLGPDSRSSAEAEAALAAYRQASQELEGLRAR